MPRFLIKKVFGLLLSFNRNAVNGSFTLDGSTVKRKFVYKIVTPTKLTDVLYRFLLYFLNFQEMIL